MRYLKILAFMVVMATMFSCHHTSEPTRIPVAYTQLNTVYNPISNDNGLLNWKEQSYVNIINSVEDVYATQTELFIHENPEWLDVDFSTKSIIAIQEFITNYNYLIGIDVEDFYIYNDITVIYVRKGDYVVRLVEKFKKHDEIEVSNDETQWYDYQVAIVTDKIPSDSRITVTLGRKME